MRSVALFVFSVIFVVDQPANSHPAKEQASPGIGPVAGNVTVLPVSTSPYCISPLYRVTLYVVGSGVSVPESSTNLYN